MSSEQTDLGPSFFGRFFLAYVIFFKVLFDGLFAARVAALRAGGIPLPAPSPSPPGPLSLGERGGTDVEETSGEPGKKAEKTPEPKPETPPAPVPQAPPADAALVLLGLLQREGRFVDFVNEDVAGASDADLAAAARVVHDGCKKALDEHFELTAIRSEDEGASITLQEGFDAAQVSLTGNVGGKPPFKGTLRHKGWRAKNAKLPKIAPGHDEKVLAPAEVEI